jgi:hypothetical protein
VILLLPLAAASGLAPAELATLSGAPAELRATVWDRSLLYKKRARRRMGGGRLRRLLGLPILRPTRRFLTLIVQGESP